ncbi:MAG: adenylyltransferase/cytidyltransferase family protein [Parcubacteria group bacterium]|nr:adenylyltransferase/cytidyltransferase family protein [Parcubacteria group bacterium]
MAKRQLLSNRKMTRTKKGNKIVFINGVFDIIHPGHILLLKFGKSLGAKLVVGINSDRTVKILKGEGRPINRQKDRRAFLEALGFIDKVVIFDDVRIGNILRRLKPDILVRGGEHTPEEIIARDGVPSSIQIKLFPIVRDFSTTEVIKKVLNKNNL